MKSPAQIHFERVSAAMAAGDAAPGASMAGASRYELMLAKLATDRRRLKAVQSVKQKIAVKKELLPEYAEYVEGVLQAGRGAQDDVLATIMIWRIDTRNFAGALAIAEYAMTHGLTLPDPYERTLPAALAEEFAEAALAAFASGDTFDGALLERVAALTADADMHDQIRAKLLKAVGCALEDDDPAAALERFRAARTFNERVGVKRDIERLEKQIQEAGDVAPPP